MSPHPYYEAKARAAMRAAGAPGAPVQQIAAWAENAKGDDRAGIIVDADGVIVAETRAVGGPITVRAEYITALHADIANPGDVQRCEAGLALPRLRRQLGRPLVQLRAAELIAGPAPRGVA